MLVISCSGKQRSNSTEQPRTTLLSVYFTVPISDAATHSALSGVTQMMATLTTPSSSLVNLYVVLHLPVRFCKCAFVFWLNFYKAESEIIEKQSYSTLTFNIPLFQARRIICCRLYNNEVYAVCYYVSIKFYSGIHRLLVSI